MGYYRGQGDFYGHGGYYRGDPGFFSNILGDFRNIVTRQVIPAAVGFMAGGPVGAIGALAGSSLGGGRSATPGIGGVASAPNVSYARTGRGGAVLANPRARLSALRTGARVAVSNLPQLIQMGQGLMPGGSTAGVPAGGGGTGGYRRRHRINVCNPKALRRAIRRARGFEKLALKSIRLVSPQKLKHRHFGGFKTARKRK